MVGCRERVGGLKLNGFAWLGSAKSSQNDEVQILPGPKPDVDGPTLAASQHERIHRGLRIQILGACETWRNLCRVHLAVQSAKDLDHFRVKSIKLLTLQTHAKSGLAGLALTIRCSFRRKELVHQTPS